jgi:hypothetical protein
MIGTVRRRRLRPALGRTLLAAGVVLAGGAPPWRVPLTEAAQAAPALVDLRSAADLRAQFNADIGTARLVLLLSPT